MNIDWVNCVLGGILIGCATAVYLIVNGQALRISDMLGELILGKISNNWNNQILFLIGLLITPIIYAHYFQTKIGHVLQSICGLMQKEN